MAGGAVESAASERRYRALFEHGPDGYVVTDSAGVILEANQGLATMVGRPLAELSGTRLASLVEPGDAEALGSALEQAGSRGAPVRADFRLVVSKDGPLDVRATVSGLGLDDGQLQWILHDVSDLRRAELAAADTRLDVLVEQLPVGVVVADAEGRIDVLNTTAQQLLRDAGLDPETPDAYLDLPLVRPDGFVYTRVNRPLVRAVEHGEQTDGERVEVRLPDGTTRQLEVSAQPLRLASGEVSGAVAVVADVSIRERRARGEREFVANAAHQLRNPLAAIRSAIEVLQAGAKDDPPARDRFLAHIERESDRLTRLARTLLVLARAQSAVEEPRQEIVEIGSLLHDVAGRLHPPEGVEVTIECSPLTAAVANAELLEEALACLADNAVRHGQGSRVVFRGRPENGALLLEVMDDGRGIPERIQDRLYERFHDTGREGFGLGLAIAAQATEATGGRLEITSSPEQGTTAVITLPVARLLTP
jgi:PAS domain S-box-containing protein